MLQLLQKTHPKVFQLDNNTYTLADAFWLSHIGTWCEADEYNLCKAELHLRNVIGADPFLLLWFEWRSFFTGLLFSC